MNHVLLGFFLVDWIYKIIKNLYFLKIRLNWKADKTSIKSDSSGLFKNQKDLQASGY
jgi:hypothetical protein